MARLFTQATPKLLNGSVYIGRFGSAVCEHCHGALESVEGLSKTLWQHQADGLTVCNGTPVEPLVSFRSH